MTEGTEQHSANNTTTKKERGKRFGNLQGLHISNLKVNNLVVGAANPALPEINVIEDSSDQLSNNQFYLQSPKRISRLELPSMIDFKY